MLYYGPRRLDAPSTLKLPGKGVTLAEPLVVSELPRLQEPILIAAFAGWPDAGEVASHALRYLQERLQAVRFAEIDPQEFYDFTQLRPQSVLIEPQRRLIRWPSNHLFSWKNPHPPQDLVLFLGHEPHLRWKTFVGSLLDLAQQCGVVRVISLGGTYDSVPHTREPRISGSASDREYQEALAHLAVHTSGYQGPTSVHSALHDACAQRGLPSASLWGHGPHYIQAVPNPKVALALLRKLARLLHLDLDLSELEGSATALDEKIEQALAQNPELRGYIHRLEEVYDTEQPPPEPLSSSAVLEELEEFLKRQQRRREERPPGSTS